MVILGDNIVITMNENSYHSLGRNAHQIIRDGSFATKKEFIHNQLFHHHIVEHNIVIQGLLKKLHASLIHERVPDFYGYYFMGQLTLCSEDRIADSVNREIQLLKGKKSHFHIITKHIDIREACLRSIAQCLESLFEQVKPAGLSKLGEQVKHLRQLSVWVIEKIKEWKSSLLLLSQNVFEDEHISFFYQGEDYLLKILRDTDFIAKSFLSEKVNFSYKQDPFLMRPCANNSPQNDFTAIFKFEPEEQQQYIKCLQFLADERADYLKRKIMAKSDKIKEIERVYQARQLNEKIIITKPNPIALRKAKLAINEAPIDFIDEPAKEDSKRSMRSSSVTELRESKARELQVKGDKIRKIKQMEIGTASPLINVKKFNSLQSSDNPATINRSISLGILKKVSSKYQKQDREKAEKEVETDFQSLVRKKELQILDTDSAKRRTISSIRLKDRLSERKLVDSKEGAEELRKILDQIEHSSPQKQESFLARKSTPSRTGRTLLQQNQEIMINLRETILKEIADDTAARQKAEDQKRQENQIMEKLIKAKLDQETLQQIEKEKDTWTLGKDVLAHDIDKRELFDLQQPTPNKSEKLSELEVELKKEMQLKFLREVQEELSHREALYKHEKERKKQEKEREKELEVVMRKEAQEKRFLEIESEERSKAMQLVLEDEERKKKEIESEMQAVIEKQQQKLIIFSNEQKVKLEADLRESMKQKLLINLKKEKSIAASERQAQERQRLLEQAHRAEVRKKMEEEFQVEKHMERQREREEKMRKLRLVAQKMDHLSQEQQQSMLIREQSLKQSNMQELKRSINKIPTTNKRQQQNKRKLREQFELELFAFNRPENFNIQQDNFVIKDFKAQIDNVQNLNKKFSEASEVLSNKDPIQIIAKESSLKASQIDHSQISENFVRFSEADKESVKKQEVQYTQEQLQLMGIDMTPAEYAMYKRKKERLDPKRIPPKQEIDMTRLQNMLDNFEKMSNIDSEKQESVFIQKQISEKPPSLKSKPVQMAEPKKQQEESPRKAAKKQPQEESEDLSEVMKLTVHSKMGSIHKKKFVTSDEDEQQEARMRRKKAAQKKANKKSNIRESSEEEDKFEKAPEKVQSAHFKTIPWQSFDAYLTSHFKKLPKVMRRLNLLRKDELLKSFENYKSLMIVEVGSLEEPEGAVFIVENENKPTTRSLNIVHFGSYKIEDLLSVVVKTRDLLFHSDPCVEITFSMYYNKADEEEETLIRQFEKQFDPYGAIFQKKISNDQTERKHILRRMIGQAGKQLEKNKAVGQLKVEQSLISHPVDQSLGVELGLQKTGSSIGGWTLLGLFLSNFGSEEQIVEELTSDVSEERKNIKHLSKMAMKLKNNRFADIECEKFESPFEANLKFIELGTQLVKCDPKLQENTIPITVMRSALTINPVLPFVSTTANFYSANLEKTGKFLRFRCGKGSKVLKLRSSLYSSVVTVIPCKPNNYKILLTGALEFDGIASQTSLDLYIKLFLANIAHHSQGTEQFIWMPQFAAQGGFEPEYGREFGLNSQLRSRVELAYTEYVPNSASFKSSHRDLFITPPFIVAVLNSDIEKCTEGSPVYLQRIDLQDLLGVTDVPTPPPESDF